MNLATWPYSSSRSETGAFRMDRRSMIPMIPQRYSGTASVPESEMIERQKRQIFLSFASVVSFHLPLELEFEDLARRWKQATSLHSSVTVKTSHPAYQRVIGMGWLAVPLILNALRHKPDFWFEALVAITGEQPVPKRHAGNIRAMAEDWLKWGSEHGYDC